MAKILQKKNFLFLLLILILATFFRLWHLSAIPPGLYPDVAMYGNDGWQSLKTGDFKVFYPENNGREGLYMWLLAFSFSVFGMSIWSLKFVGAFFGILTVLGLYLLTKEIFRNTKYEMRDTNSIALLSTFFLATSFWHNVFSRDGFRVILLPFFLVFAFYFLFRGFRTKKFFNFIIVGIFLGLGFYTYISYRFVVLILPFVLIPWWLIYKKNNGQKKFLIFTLCFLLFAFITALPIGIYFLQHPQDFTGRAAGVSIFTQANPIKAFFISLAAHLGMFNFYGDPNWRHNFSGFPMLPFFLGILFLIGLVTSFKKVINLKNHKNWDSVIGYWTMIVWFFVMLLPGILTIEGIPHALRTIAVTPAVYVFIGLGAFLTYQWFEKNIKNKKLLISAAVFIIFTTGFLEFYKIFFSWGRNPELKNAFSADYVDMGNYLNSLPDGIEKYVIVNKNGVAIPYPNGIPMPAQTIMFMENAEFGSLRATYLLPQDIEKIKVEKNAVIIPMTDDEQLFNQLKEFFPEGKIQLIKNFKIFKI